MEKPNIKNLRFELMSSTAKGFKEVQVIFNYNGEDQKYFVFVKEDKNVNYLAKAKEQFDQDLKSGKVVKNIKKAHTYHPWLITGASVLGAAAITFAVLFAYKVINVPPQYDVYVPDINGLIITEEKAVSGENFVANIAVNPELTDEILPEQLTSVKIGDTPCDYTYTPNPDYLSAKLLIDKSLITDKVNIELSLRKLWYLDTEYLNSLKTEDINANGGITQTVIVNGQPHKVRLIGVDHDELADNSGKAHTTWEFMDYISDSNGYSIATPWNWENGDKSISANFPESNLRKAIDGQGKGEVVWYEKGSSTKSTTYTTSVIDMLPTKLKSALKEVKKDTVVSYQFKHDTFNTKLFPLSYREMTAATAKNFAEEGTTYPYYKGMVQDKDIRRLKHQVKWHDGAVLDKTDITDKELSIGLLAENYAGFNSPVQECYGGYCWLRSPYTGTAAASSAWQLSVGGTFLSYSVYREVLAVAPAFCI